MEPVAVSNLPCSTHPWRAEKLGELAPRFTVPAMGAAVSLLTTGFVLGLGLGPWDQNQLAMLHVPAVWISTLLLLSAAFWAATALVLENEQGHLLVQAIVPTGGMFSFLALWSGALWIKSQHGVWWLGSAREWAGVALLAVYIVMLCLPALISEVRRADRSVSVLALLGVSQVLLIYFSTAWWNAGLEHREEFSVVAEMNPAMLSVAGGFWAYATATASLRIESLLIERQRAPQEMTTWS